MRDVLGFVRRKGAAAVLAVATMAAAVIAFPPGPGQSAAAQAQPATASAVPATGLYASVSGLVMDAGGARRSGVTVVLHADGTAHGKRWVREPDGTIRPAYDRGLCLGVPRAHYEVGAKLDVETCKGLRSQHFAEYRSSASTPVFFISPAGDRRLCVSTRTGTFLSGDAIALDGCGSMLTAPGTEVWATASPSPNAGGITSTTALAVTGTTAGSAVTAAKPFSLPLGALWQVTTETVSPFGRERVLRPLSNTSLCMTREGAEASGTPLRLEQCASSARQAFMGVQAIINVYNPAYFITVPDGRLCVTIKGGAISGHPAILGPCVGTAADTWSAANGRNGIDLTSPTSLAYQELYLNDAPTMDYTLGLTGTGAGAKAVMAPDREKASQVWTDLPPSGAGLPHAVGNPDGSISLRPLSNTALCLTVPGANFAAGQQLTVQPCDGRLGQEFVRLPGGAPGNAAVEELVAYGGASLCVGAASMSYGAAVILAPCGAMTLQSWVPMEAWYQWGGAPDAFTSQAGGGVLTMSAPSGTTASALVAPASVSDAAKAWLPSAGTIHPVANGGWCLDAPSLTAGAVVTVQACDGTMNQDIGVTLVPGTSSVELVTAATPALCLAPGAGSAVVLQACSASDESQWLQETFATLRWG